MSSIRISARMMNILFVNFCETGKRVRVRLDPYWISWIRTWKGLEVGLG